MGQLLGTIHMTDDWSAEQIAFVRRKRLDRVSGFAEAIATRDNTTTVSATAQISWDSESAINDAEQEESPLIELQTTIAAMAKVSHETVSRVLRCLTHRGAIAREGRLIRICDRIALHTLAVE
jgi:Crp-like helix-turn-helix domain